MHGADELSFLQLCASASDYVMKCNWLMADISNHVGCRISGSNRAGYYLHSHSCTAGLNMPNDFYNGLNKGYKLTMRRPVTRIATTTQYRAKAVSMSAIQLKDIPRTRRDWEKKVKQTLGEDDHLSFAIPRMKSASRVDFNDWLRLKVLWKLDKRAPLTHKFLFNDQSDTRRWATLQADSKAFLQTLDWYPALQSFSDDPRDWGTLASWRQSTLTISRRLSVLEKMSGPTLQPQLSGEDLFASSKVWLEPMVSQGSQMDTSGQHNQEDETEMVGEEAGSKSIARRIHRNQQGSWTRPKDEAVPNRNYSDSDESMGDYMQASPADSSNESSEAQASSTDNSHMTGSSMSFLVARLARPPDEEIINMSLVLLLEGLCMQDPELYGKIGWYPIRKAFTVKQAGVKIMTARTDGCLQVIQPDRLEEDCPSLAILEAKADLRTEESAPVYLQEGAEMAAWISSEYNHGLLHGSQEAGTYRRVLISQNFNQVYVTIAEYDDDYVRYITGNSTTRASSGSPTQNLSSNKASSNKAHSSFGQESRPEQREEMVSIRQISQSQLERTPSPQEDLSHLQNAPLKNRDRDPNQTYDYTKGFLVMRNFRRFKITEQKDVEELMILLISIVRELYRGSRWNTRL